MLPSQTLEPNWHPKKKFSQNFLVNPQMQAKVGQRMLAFVKQYHAEYLVEIGPGRGELTQYLLQAELPLIAIEIDRDAISYLKQRWPTSGNLTVLQQDALVWLTERHSEKFVLLSNLPFQTGSRMLVELPILYPQVPFAVILQTDVANKTRCNSGPTFFGFWLNLFWNLQIEFDIAPGNFYPTPKVFSSLVTASPKSQLPDFLATADLRQRARQWLKQLFSKPRKTIGNNLKTVVTSEYPSEWQKQRLTWENYSEVLRFLVLQEFLK